MSACAAWRGATASVAAACLGGWRDGRSTTRREPLDRVFRIVDAVTRIPPESPVTSAPGENAIVTIGDRMILIAREGPKPPSTTVRRPFRVGFGEAIGAVLVSRDITERRQAESALRRSEERLRQSQKLEAIGRLTAGVAHDVNNIARTHSRFPYNDLARLAAGDGAAEPSRVLVAEDPAICPSPSTPWSCFDESAGHDRLRHLRLSGMVDALPARAKPRRSVTYLTVAVHDGHTKPPPSPERQGV